MQFRQKLAYMALGGVLVLAGHVLPGLMVGSATAQDGLQDAEFNKLTVRKLTVVDDDGTTAAIMGVDPDGGVVVVYQTDGTRAAAGPRVVVMGVKPSGGSVVVYQTDGTMTATMGADPDGGSVVVHRPDGTIAAIVAADPDGGGFVLLDKHSKPQVILGVDENGNGFVMP